MEKEGYQGYYHTFGKNQASIDLCHILENNRREIKRIGKFVGRYYSLLKSVEEMDNPDHQRLLLAMIERNYNDKVNEVFSDRKYKRLISLIIRKRIKEIVQESIKRTREYKRYLKEMNTGNGGTALGPTEYWKSCISLGNDDE